MLVSNLTIYAQAFNILRHHGATMFFGNPGSNEIPILDNLPDDFSYILALHESVALSMAEGYAQSKGVPTMLSLHSNGGTGNAMGTLVNAHYSHSPLILMGGQQNRGLIGVDSVLTNNDATLLTKPLTKWAYEPPQAADVPRAVSNAVLQATTEPKGPVYLSVPWDDWYETAAEDDALLELRTVRTAGAMAPDLVDELAKRLDGWKKPLIVLGPDVDAARANDYAVQLAERLGAEVWIAPSASRVPFPTRHANYRGAMSPSHKAVKGVIEGHDGMIVIGAPIFRYHMWDYAHYLPEPRPDVVHITRDPNEAARAPFGDAIVANIFPALQALAGAVTNRNVTLEPRTIKPPTKVDGKMTGEEVLDIISNCQPPNVTFINEATSLGGAWLERVDIKGIDSFKSTAGGILGYGMGAAVGVSFARPDDTVVAVIGDGSTQYAVQALWTAAQHKRRVIFIIANNGVYGGVKSFAPLFNATDVPGLDLPDIDFLGLAQGYGVPASRTNTTEGFEAAFKDALDAQGPVLIEAVIAYV